MIFFPFFVERWTMACQGITAEQEGVYLRLLVWMYANECELPLDLSECCRIARCVSRDERDTVGFVLSRYMSVTPTGHTQKKAVAEIEHYQLGEPARAARRDVNTARKRRHREEQRRLYALAREQGVPTRRGMRMADLRELLGIPEPTGNVVPLSLDESRGVSRRDSVTSPQGVPNVQTHTHTHTMSLKGHTASRDTVVTPDGEKGGLEALPSSEQPSAERLVAAVRALRAGGLVAVNSGHPLLHALLAAGVDNDALTWASANAVSKGKGFAYALAACEGQMRDAAAAALPSAKEREGASRVAQWAPGLEAKW